MKDESTFECRRINVSRLVEGRFKGNQAKFAEAIDRSANYVNRMLTTPKHGKARKRIGESMARHIESKLELDPGSLDVSSTLKVGERQGRYVVEQSLAAQQLARDFDKLPELAQAYVADIVANVMNLIRRDEILARVMFSAPDPKAHERAMQRIVEYQQKYRASKPTADTQK